MTSPVNRLRLHFLDRPGMGKRVRVTVAIVCGITALVYLLSGHQGAVQAYVALGLGVLWVPPFVATARRLWLARHIRHEAAVGEDCTRRISELYKPTDDRLTELKQLEELWNAPTTEEPVRLS